MTNEGLRKALWWVCLVAAPLVLFAIELYHPAGFTRDPQKSYAGEECVPPGMFAYLSEPQPYNPCFKALAYPGPSWWFALHMIQTPMVALVAIGLWLFAGRLTQQDRSAAVGLGWLSRVATFVFLVYYTSLDSIGGSGLGRTILNTQALRDHHDLSPEQVAGVARVLDTTWVDPWVGGVGSFISLTGSWAVFASIVLLVVALLVAKKAPWPVLALLLVFGWELQLSHTNPHGPIAFAALIAAAIWTWVSDRRSAAAR